MTGAEKGFLLLTSRLGNPQRRVLTPAQLRILSARVQAVQKPPQERELNENDLVALGYGRETAAHICALLDEEALLWHYCRRAEKAGCVPLARVSAAYPPRLWEKLGEETPGCLWCKGNLALLTQPSVALVGSRDIMGRNRAFASEVGRQAAMQGYVLVSGNARGADRAAQSACLRAGGRVICVVADSLTDKVSSPDILYLSEDEFDAPFSAQRAISRNRLIHTLSRWTFVAQCGDRQGGTWDGTAKNLRHGWSTVCCFDDGSEAMQLLMQMGAQKADMQMLTQIEQIQAENSLFDQSGGTSL